MGMKLIAAADYQDMSQKAASIFLKQMEQKKQSVLGLATGGTVKGVYSELVDVFIEGEISFAEAASFNLDEYFGMKKEDPNSYFSYMQEQFFSKTDFALERNHIPDGTAADPMEECSRYDRLIEQAGGVDLQLLGIGENGHIGFNEPGTPFEIGTHLVRLTESTRQANARYFETMAQVPKEAITMGIGTIMKSRKIVLLASGVKKAGAIEQLWYGEVTEDFPASVLKQHPDATIIADKEALSGIRMDGKGELHQ
ncbi:glucosamine-6-phosphate deaminase [Metabacillus sp. KIGAM252]|uniref:Glucosamine-6-phosphate deaminase n=1 Tax=Metabacillus flavus TaxID=2823519 RepID=A0ABS5LBV6_9BACI|nr:glucosamine-6-phosphate deaminase [Metabacillus flavus]MBS2967939.1 glucosamine-6-phosphate deaminase [Metabacillus flavus]